MLQATRALVVGLLVVSASGDALGQRSYAGSTSQFTLTEKTEVPGGILKPGQYSIHIVDQLSDRMIVRIDSASSTDHTMFLGIPHSDFGDAAQGAIRWSSGLEGTGVLRGFEFTKGSTVEFVYPKTEAVALAKLNAAKVVAVDPDSEGRPVLSKMSQDDLQVVTLWTLSLTATGTDAKTPAIQAQRYVPTPVVAENAPAGPASRTVAPREVSTLDQPRSPEHVAQPASPKSHHVIARLPHTAGYMPVIWATGLCCLLLAGILHISRVTLLSRRS